MLKSSNTASYELGLDELDGFALELLQSFKSGVVILRGDLAAGKTTLTKALCAACGVDKTAVSSPTFSLMHEYGGGFHYDLYRSDFDSICQNGLFENFFEDGLHIAEWGDERLENALKKYKIPLCIIKISALENSRKYEVSFA